MYKQILTESRSPTLIDATSRIIMVKPKGIKYITKKEMLQVVQIQK